MNFLKVIINKIIVKLWIKRNLNFKKFKYFFCPSGIGDTLYVLSYMKEYRKKNPNIKVCFIIKKSHLSIIKMYNEDVDDVIILDGNFFNYLSLYLENKRDEENIIYAHPLKIIFDPCKILGIKNLCLLDLYKVVLDLPTDSPYCLPIANKSDNIKLKKLCNETKKILLCPYCVSTTMISNECWEYIADYFISNDYKVYTNVRENIEQPIKNTKPLSLNLNELYGVIDTFSYVFSIRSGLCDLISFSSVNLTVFYQSDDDKYNSKEYNVYNFKNIGVREDINEVIVKDFNDVIKYINSVNIDDK